MKEPIDPLLKESSDPPAAAPVARNSATLRLIGLALLAVGLLTLLFVRATAPGGAEQTAVGQRLATFEVEPLTGAATPIRSDDLQGHVVLVNFWGTWCPPCRREFPHLLEIDRQFRGQPDFLFVSISCGADNMENPFQENTAELRLATQLFLNGAGAELPTYTDRFGSTRLATQKAAGQEHFLYPTTLVLDRKGMIRAVWQGFTPGVEVEIETLLRELLEN